MNGAAARDQVQKMRENQGTYRNEVDSLREKHADFVAEKEKLSAEMKELSARKGIRIFDLLRKNMLIYCAF